jgi:alpha-glucoside transport system permease protein
MSTTTPSVPPAPVPQPSHSPTTEGDAPPLQKKRLSRVEKRAIATKGKLSSPWASGLAILIAILWTLPSIGLLVTSFRPALDIRRSGWWTIFPGLFSGESQLTLENYQEALFGQSTNLATYFVNSFVITIPAVVIPITVALLAAYAFAWIDFRGRNILFVAVFALQVVPLQVALVPLLTDYVEASNSLNLPINGSFWTVWLSHSIFALPLAIFLLHNFMQDIPPSLVEAARVDGAGHVKIFFQVLFPLLVPAIAAFGIFQFLWVWNDLLVGLTFADPGSRPLTVAVAELAGTRGGQWHLLTAGAFISMVVPLVVFIALQRYFVRGLLAGSVKG